MALISASPQIQYLQGERVRTANEFKNTLIDKHKFDTDFRIITPAGNIRYIHANTIIGIGFLIIMVGLASNLE